MPFGPFEDFEDCLTDAGMLERYPSDEVRGRVCGALKARLEAGGDVGVRGVSDAGELRPGSVTEGEDFWIVHDVVAAREGVNARGEFKPWAALRVGAATLEGAPLVYGGATGHPLDASGSLVVDVDPRDAVGHAVNVRADEASRSVLYDALVFKSRPVGVRSDVALNERLVQLVRAGFTVDNSVGYHVREVAEVGVFDGVPFTIRQDGIRFGHVSILAPLSPHRGACSSEMGCGFNVAGDACGGGDGCCGKRVEAAVADLVRQGLSRGAALKLIVGVQSNSPKHY